LAKDQTRRCGVRVEFPGFIDDATFGGGGATAEMDQLSFGAHATRLRRYSANEVHFELERRITRSGRQHRVDRAPHRRVEQRGGETTMHYADRIVMIFRRVHSEDSASLFQLNYLKIHQRRERRPW
jgi:hypothetical protein